MTNSYISEFLDLKDLLHFSTTVSGPSIVIQGRQNKGNRDGEIFES